MHLRGEGERRAAQHWHHRCTCCRQRRRINAEPKQEQLSIDTTAAQTVAYAAAEKAAAGVSHDLHAAAKKAAASAAAPERVAAEAAATVNNMSGEIKHLQLLLATERAIFHAAPESAIAQCRQSSTPSSA